MRIISTSALAFVILTSMTLAQDIIADDPAMTIEEMQALLIGNSWSFNDEGADFKEYFDPNGELRGIGADGKYTAHWKYREYDNLFCWDNGEIGMDPMTDGCAQFVLKGGVLAVRRLDGYIHAFGKLAPGNAFGL